MKKILISFALLIFGVGCQPAKVAEPGPNSSPTSSKPGLSTTPAQTPASQSDQTETVTPIPTQLTEFQPSPESPAANENHTNWEGDQLPVFLEISQTTILKNDSTQGPSLGVGPTIYFYNPDNKVLMLHSTVLLDAKTKVLIGVTHVLQTPNQKYEKKEIVQFPAMQPTLIQVETFDADTGTITVLFEDQVVELTAGESRTFKQVGSGFNTSTLITIVSNHGHLEAIQPVSYDGSLR